MLRRWLFTHTSFTGDPTAALGRVEADTAPLLRAAFALTDDEPRPDGSFQLAARGADLDEFVLDAVVDPVSREGARVRIPLRWSARDHGDGSTFEGALEVERVGNATVELSLYGQYAAGEKAANPQALLEMTEATGRRLLRAVARELGHARNAAVRMRSPRLRVRDLMTADPLVLAEDTPLRTAALVLLHRGIGGAPIVDDEGKLVGVLTETDLLVREAAPRNRRGHGAREEARRRLATTAGEACSRPAITVHPEAPAREAARQLFDEDVSRLVVVDGGRVVGILTRHDVLRALTRSPEELEAAVEAAVAGVVARGIGAQVLSGGRVVLEGRTEWRTTAQEVVNAVAGVDGVTGVVDHIEWATDDVPRSPRAWSASGAREATE